MSTEKITKQERLDELSGEIANLTIRRPIKIRDGQQVVVDRDLDRYLRMEIKDRRDEALALRGYYGIT